MAWLSAYSIDLNISEKFHIWMAGGTIFHKCSKLYVVVRCRRVGCGLSVVRQSACLVVGPVTVGGCAALFGCAPVDRASGSMVAPAWGYSFWLVGAGAFVCCLVHRGSADYLLLLRVFGGVV